MRRLSYMPSPAPRDLAHFRGRLLYDARMFAEDGGAVTRRNRERVLRALLGAVAFACASLPAVAIADRIPSRDARHSPDDPDWARRAWRQGDPAPPGYHLESGPWNGMIVGGVIPLSILYAFSFLGASMSGYRNASGWLVVPGVGPWLTLAFRERSCETDSYDGTRVCEVDDMVGGLLIFDGIGQSLGVALIAVGMSTERHRLVRDSWSFRPMRVGTGYGFGISGQL